MGQEQEGDIDEDQHQVARKVAGGIGNRGEEALAALIEHQMGQRRRVIHVHQAVGVLDQAVDLLLIFRRVAPELRHAIGEQCDEADKAAKDDEDGDSPRRTPAHRMRPVVDHPRKALDYKEQEHRHRKCRKDTPPQIEEGDDHAGCNDPYPGLGRAIHAGAPVRITGWKQPCPASSHALP